MSAYDAMIVTGAERGWGVDLQLELACQYIENQGSNEAFYGFLAIAGEEENASDDEWWANEPEPVGASKSSLIEMVATGLGVSIVELPKREADDFAGLPRIVEEVQ